jgi:hypothetical protein
MSDFDPDLNNPYRAPVTADAPPLQDVEGEATTIRREHLNHEASIQGIGSLYVLGGILSAIGGLAFLAGGIAAPNAGGAGMDFAFVIGLVLLAVCIGIFQLAVGLGMRKVKPWVKIPATVLAAVGLLHIPVGTLLSVYVLYLLHSSKGRVVLDESYQQVIAQTPEIKYKTSIIVKVLVVILLLFLALAIGGAVFSAVGS